MKFQSNGAITNYIEKWLIYLLLFVALGF